jgi:hypothetical protein
MGKGKRVRKAHRERSSLSARVARISDPAERGRLQRLVNLLSMPGPPPELVATMGMLGDTYARLPRTPSCAGPLFVHADGGYECHGLDCLGELAVWHSPTSVVPCVEAQLPTRCACGVCGL